MPKLRCCAGVSTSFTLNGTGGMFVPRSIVWFAMLEMVGGSFAFVTVNVKLLALYPNCESVTHTVTVAVPERSDAGVIVTERFASVPLNANALVGNRSGL